MRYLSAYGAITISLALLAIGTLWFMIASYKRKGKRPGA